jgi:type VI protein secretion system component VasK
MTNYPLLDIFLSILYFFCWILWIMLLFWIILDIFRSRDLSGWGKAGWLIFIIVLPFLGVLVYLIARGGKMQERQVRDAQAQDQAFRAYVRDAAGTDGHDSADQLATLASLHDRGVLSDEEFQRAKASVLSS